MTSRVALRPLVNLECLLSSLFNQDHLKGTRRFKTKQTLNITFSTQNVLPRVWIALALGAVYVQWTSPTILPSCVKYFRFHRLWSISIPKDLGKDHEHSKVYCWNVSNVNRKICMTIIGGLISRRMAGIQQHQCRKHWFSFLNIDVLPVFMRLKLTLHV